MLCCERHTEYYVTLSPQNLSMAGFAKTTSLKMVLLEHGTKNTLVEQHL